MVTRAAVTVMETAVGATQVVEVAVATGAMAVRTAEPMVMGAEVTAPLAEAEVATEIRAAGATGKMTTTGTKTMATKTMTTGTMTTGTMTTGTKTMTTKTMMTGTGTTTTMMMMTNPCAAPAAA
jgi:hypothetical protein